MSLSRDPPPISATAVILPCDATCLVPQSEILQSVTDISDGVQDRSKMRIAEFRLTRFQFARDRVIGDSQVCADAANIAALELIDEKGRVGLGFIQTLFHRLPSQDEITRVFEDEAWPGLVGQPALGLGHRVNRPRGGNQRAYTLPFHEALQVALWDLAAKQVDMPLHQLLG